MRGTSLDRAGPVRERHSTAPRGRRRGACSQLPRKEWTERGGLVNTYDALNRLSAVDDGSTVLSYAYDDAGNRTEVDSDSPGTSSDWTHTYGYSALNQLDTLTKSNGPSESFTYDDAGQMIGESDGSSSTSIGWDPLGEMTELDQTGPGGGDVTYEFDALSRSSLRLMVAT